MIRVYLRASTKEQDASRAKAAIDEFLVQHNQTTEHYYIENQSGSKLDRPQLMQLIEDSEAGDVLVVEQVDRLTRLTPDDWKQLKRTIEDKGLIIVSLDLPTSHTVFTNQSTSLTTEIMKAVNNLLLDILAVTARKDYEDRRRRQAEGIQRAIDEGRWKGRQRTDETMTKFNRVNQLVQERNYPLSDAIKVAEISRATYYRIKKEQNQCH